MAAMLKHAERRNLPYTAQQLFELVAHVEKYPEFIKWFVAARIRRRNGNVLEVDQVVRLANLPIRFATRAVLDRPRQIRIISKDPPFRSFDQRWTFTPARDGVSTIVQYKSALELRSSLLQRVAGAFFDEHQVAEATIDAFARRALQIYGPLALDRRRNEPHRPGIPAIPAAREFLPASNRLQRKHDVAVIPITGCSMIPRKFRNPDGAAPGTHCGGVHTRRRIAT